MNVRRSRWTADLGHVRPGQQTRSQKTQAALLDAAERLFAERGVEATTIGDIAELAESSVGSFYHHFRDKVGVQFAVFDRYMSDAETTTLDAVDPSRWDGAAIVDILRAYVEFALISATERPSARRATLAVAATDFELRSRIDKLSATLDVGLRELMLARRAEIRHVDPELAVGYVLHLLGAVLRSRMEVDPSHSRYGPDSDDDFVDETVRVVSSYLGVSLA